MNEKDRFYQRIGFKAAVVFSIAVAFLIIGANVLNETNMVDIKLPDPLNFVKPDAEWHTMSVSSGKGLLLFGTNTVFVEIFYINLSDGDNYFTNENNTGTLEGYCTANGLGYITADNIELDIAHSTNFAIVAKAQGDSDHCKRGSTWWDTDLNCTLTWNTDGYSLTNAQPDHITTYPQANMNTSDYTYLYKMFVWDNSNSGFSIAKGANTGTDPILELAAYY